MSSHRRCQVDALCALTAAYRPAPVRLTDAQARSLAAFARDHDCTWVDLHLDVPGTAGWCEVVVFSVFPLRGAPVSGRVDALGRVSTFGEVAA